MNDEKPSLESLREAVEWACQPQSIGPIEQGREQVLAMPRAWVLKHIAAVAETSLDLNDYWEYRRLLELLDMLDPRLLDPFVRRGLASPDPDVREAAEDYHRT